MVFDWMESTKRPLSYQWENFQSSAEDYSKDYPFPHNSRKKIKDLFLEKKNDLRIGVIDFFLKSA